MQQMFGTDSCYIPDDGRTHDITCALWPVKSGENTAGNEATFLLSKD